MNQEYQTALQRLKLASSPCNQNAINQIATDLKNSIQNKASKYLCPQGQFAQTTIIGFGDGQARCLPEACKKCAEAISSGFEKLPRPHSNLGTCTYGQLVASARILEGEVESNNQNRLKICEASKNASVCNGAIETLTENDLITFMRDVQKLRCAGGPGTTATPAVNPRPTGLIPGAR